MELTDLKIGKKLELEIYDSSGKMLEYLLISEFEWAEDENIAFIADPIFEGDIYQINQGTLIIVYVANKFDYYKFKAKVLERTIRDGFRLLKIQKWGDIEKIQRRQFFRFECILPIKYRVISSSNSQDSIEARFIEVITKDISGGGIRIRVKEELNLKELVECELILGGKKIEFSGEIVRKIQCKFEGKYKYELGVMMKEIADQDREAIIQYIFNAQRELRKKGLI